MAPKLKMGVREHSIGMLRDIGVPLRIPTLTWLFSDVFGILDSQARSLITELIKSNILKDNGMGWLEVMDE